MRETLIRTASGLIYIFLLIGATLYSSATFQVLFGILMLISIYEYCRLIKTSIWVPMFVGALLYSLFSLISKNSVTSILILIPTLYFSVNTMILLFKNDMAELVGDQKLRSVGNYIILPFIIIAQIPFEADFYNPKIIISIFILIWINDTFAYIVGKTIGKNKLFESISPKKTIEGFIGGLGFAMLGGLLLSQYYLHQPYLIWVIIALIIAIFGTIGDLIESRFKRIAKVKDSGKIMPGHGGILDRLDSIIFAAPFVFLFFQILNLLARF
ncbi:phosphatidate cytidylyltransferase [Flavobacterium ardleyense]|uniref:phosphatidate cytidylyltransferase n=1 Tax=Flavobacterium ardleyense TaxID=2038737 RepID=UPI00298C4162|nr:phosphatidate cytidylyltransferase [Flavobacterium ardleyense]